VRKHTGNSAQIYDLTGRLAPLRYNFAIVLANIIDAAGARL
jgi:hypothetical protein